MSLHLMFSTIICSKNTCKMFAWKSGNLACRRETVQGSVVRFLFFICSVSAQSFEIVVISWKRIWCKFLISVLNFHLKHKSLSNSRHKPKLINWFMCLEWLMFQCLHRLCSDILYARKQTQYDHNPWKLKYF